MEMKRAAFGWPPPGSSYDWFEVLRELPATLENQRDLVPTRLEHWLEKVPVGNGAASLGKSLSRGGDTATMTTRCPGHDTKELDRHITSALAYWMAMAQDEVPRIRLTRGRFLLFFDGGSRCGNSGPGGSGAVIVRVRDGFEIIWMASMSYAGRSTTNNYAEFQGLCAGLRAALHRRWHPLTVIGDSAMILSLMRRRKPPKAPSLRPLFQHAQQAAAALRVTGWHYHYRTLNKTADKAVNIARRSVQTFAQDARAELDELLPYLNNDVGPWTERLLTSHRSPDRPTDPDDEAQGFCHGQHVAGG